MQQRFRSIFFFLHISQSLFQYLISSLSLRPILSPLIHRTEETGSLALRLRSPSLFVSGRRLSSSPVVVSRFIFKCAVEYSRDHYSSSLQVPVAHPRPTEVPWKKELCNTVQLIGVVGLPVEIKHLPSGKVLAWTRLAVKKSATDTSWINLTFWDDLAHVAFQHLEKGNQIYVSGRLISDAVETSEGKQQTYYKVVVQQLNFVEKSSSSVNGQDSDSFTPGRSSSHSFTKHTETTQELWQAFFANPGEWWDNRKTKRNSKYPDFKHKDTGEALWIEGRNNPPWVKSQLAILDTRYR